MSAKKGKTTLKSSLAKLLNENVSDHKISDEFFAKGTKRKSDSNERGVESLFDSSFFTNDVKSMFNAMNTQIESVLQSKKSKGNKMEIIPQLDTVLKEVEKRKKQFHSDFKLEFQAFLSELDKNVQNSKQIEKKLEQILKDQQANKEKTDDLYERFLEKLKKEIVDYAASIDDKTKSFFDEIKKYLDKDVEKQIRRILSEESI